MGRYHLEFGENERVLLVLSLSAIGLIRPTLKAVTDEPPADCLQLLERILFLKPALVPRAPEPAPSSDTTESRRGVGEPLKLQNPPPAPIPPGAKKLEIDKVEAITRSTAGDRLVVRWNAVPGKQNGGQASCWIKDLFPAVLRTVKKPAVFYIEEKQKGTVLYQNIVAVQE